MLDLFRLGHKIGPFDEFDWRAAARDNDVLHRRPSIENRQDTGPWHISVMEDDIEFVENHHRIAGIPQKGAGRFPGVLRKPYNEQPIVSAEIRCASSP